MFWECHIVTSSIDKLLDQPIDQIKLQDLLDENDLIQECLNQNNRLLDYLIQPNIMNELIHHIITLPTDNNFRNANIVSELFSGDFQRIQEHLLEKVNLNLLYSFLLSTNDEILTLNPILASYFSRILITLIIRKPIEIINYLKSRETFKEDVLRHLDSTSITDILYRLISDSGEQRSNTIQWYEDINLIDGLMQQFLITESISVQINTVNLLSEFLRLAFDQQTGMEGDMTGPSLSSTIERLLYNRTENNEGSARFNRLSSSSDDENKSSNGETEGKLTPLILAQHILSKSNLELFFDALIKRPILVANGCDFLDNILDLISRYMPVPICIPLTSLSEEKLTTTDESSSSDKHESEHMQINDEGDTPPVNKSNENGRTNTVTLTNLVKDPLVRIYLILLEVLPSRLPSLIALLSTPCSPLIPSNDDSQTVKYQFINEPLGSLRLNLIKFFSKLIYTISNDYTGDNIYQIFNSNRLFHKLLDLFLHHIYNNFLHTQVYLTIRLIIHINSMAVKQSNDIWTRTPITNQDQDHSDSSPFHYTNRCSYKLFQSLLTSSEVNLFERLLDQYELNIASNKPVSTSVSSDDVVTSSVVQTRFSSPNSGHIAQIFRCLRDHILIFDNYSSFFKPKIDEDTNVLEIRWQTALDHLNGDEKKWSAMHHNERNNTNNFRLNSAATFMTQTNNLNDSSEANYRRQTFHMKSFGTSGTPYGDDEDDDDEVERFDIDDELMNNEQTSTEKKVAEMKKISFEPQFPSVFDEQTLWYQQDNINPTKAVNHNEDNDNMKTTSAPILPDLFENHRIQQEKSASSTESNFEQLCSLRANEHDNGSGLFPFQSSSTIREEGISNNDEFWKTHPIYLINTKKSISSSSDEDNDDENEEESKIDTNIPDDEKFFVHNDMETIEPNNMMDIFRRQPIIPNDANNNSNEEDDALEKNEVQINQQPISSSTPERVLPTQALSPTNDNDCQKKLSFVDQDDQQNGEMNSDDDDDDDDSALQDNFSFLIAKGMLKPSSF